LGVILKEVIDFHVLSIMVMHAAGGDLFLYNFHLHAINNTDMTAETEQY
jgi:hypothetical protein